MTTQPSSQPGKPSSPRIIVKGKRAHIFLTVCNPISEKSWFQQRNSTQFSAVASPFSMGRETLKREETEIGKPQVK